MRSRLVHLAALISGLALSTSAEAAPKHRIAFRLEYDAPSDAGCPDVDELSLMLGAEFGYLVVRTDVSPVVSVIVRHSGKRFEAEVSAPDPGESVEPWHGKTDTQGSCRELTLDLASLVKLRLGPRAWPGEEPPPSLAAPPDIEVRSPEIHPVELPRFESLAMFAPQSEAQPGESTAQPQEASMQAEIGLGPAVMPYGLPSVGIGGNALIGLRWPRFAVFADFRGLTTPSSDLGGSRLPVQTTVWTGSAFPCYASRHIDACAVFSVSQVQFDLGDSYRITSSDTLSVGFGGRFQGHVALSERFTLIGYADLNMQLRNIVLALDPSLVASGDSASWRSPLLRISLGIGVTANITDL